MGRQLIIEQKQIGNEVLNDYNSGMSCNAIAEKYDLNPINVINFIEKINNTSKEVILYDEKMAQKNIVQTLEIHQRLVQKIEEIENFIKQLKNPETGDVNLSLSKEYLVPLSLWL